MIKFIKKIRKEMKLVEGEEITRRYFVMNSFDGVLTVLGILLGSFISGAIVPHTIIKITLATGLAMFISGFFGTYVTEEAEREKDIDDLEHALLTNLDNSVLKKASKTVAFVSSIVDGISPLLASVIVISPFFFSSVVGTMNAFYISLCLSFMFLFVLGLYLGDISKNGRLKSGIKMLVVGLIAVLLMSILGLF